MGLGAFCLIMYRVPITSPDAEATYRGYWEKKTTLPIEHPFGNKHHPDGTASALLNLQTDPASPDEMLQRIRKNNRSSNPLPSELQSDAVSEDPLSYIANIALN